LTHTVYRSLWHRFRAIRQLPVDGKPEVVLLDFLYIMGSISTLNGISFLKLYYSACNYRTKSEKIEWRGSVAKMQNS